MVQGRAEFLETDDDAGPAKSPPPLPLVDQRLTAALRISMELFTGRQYRTSTESTKET
jgi:hypothetical protein